jgi:hypothetical protein
MIENGQRPLDKRADIAALASALEVSADALLGQPAPEIQPGRQTLNLLPLRAVLLDGPLMTRLRFPPGRSRRSAR